jgi:hypothetical protein
LLVALYRYRTAASRAQRRAKAICREEAASSPVVLVVEPPLRELTRTEVSKTSNTVWKKKRERERETENERAKAARVRSLAGGSTTNRTAGRRYRDILAADLTASVTGRVDVEVSLLHRLRETQKRRGKKRAERKKERERGTGSKVPWANVSFVAIWKSIRMPALDPAQSALDN